MVDKGTIAWKVVHDYGRGERVSCIVKAPNYRLRYDKGHTVHAVEGTIGIMCFKTKKEALKFRDTNDTTVIKVRGFGRRRFQLQVSWQCTWTNYKLDYFYSKDRRPIDLDVHPILSGTILFDRVDVLT